MTSAKHEIELIMPEGILDDFDVKLLRKAFDEFWCWYNARYNMPTSVDLELVKLKSDYTYRVVLAIEQDVSPDVLEDIRRKLEEIFEKYGLYTRQLQ